MMKTRSSGAEGESRSVVRRSPDYPYKKSSSVVSSRNRGPPGLRLLMTTRSLQGDSGSSPKRGVLSTLKRRTMILFSKMTVLLVLLTFSSCCNATGSFTLKEATDLGFSILKKDPKCGENGTYFNIHSTGVPQEHATRVFRHNMAWTMEKSRRQTIALLAGPQMPATGLMDGVDYDNSSQCHGGPSSDALQEATEMLEERCPKREPEPDHVNVEASVDKELFTHPMDPNSFNPPVPDATDTEGEDEDQKEWDHTRPRNQTYAISINVANREKILHIKLQSQQREVAAAQNEIQREEAQRKVDETKAEIDRHERKQAQKLSESEHRNEDPDSTGRKLGISVYQQYKAYKEAEWAPDSDREEAVLNLAIAEAKRDQYRQKEAAEALAAFRSEAEL